jgi:hypothetical protein
MTNKIKKYAIAIFTVSAFAVLMTFNVTSTDQGFDFSLCGETVLASDGTCQEVKDGTPNLLNYTGDPNHNLNCNHAGNGCVPCTSTPL